MNNKPAKRTGIKAGRNNKVSDRTKTKPTSKAAVGAKPVKAGQTLTKAEKVRLQQFEKRIGEGLASFVAVGKALSEIRAGRLYREKSDTFEDYCERWWDMDASYAYRHINAAKCFESLQAKLPKGAILPRNEAQVRPLVERLMPEKWVKAWEAVIADTKGVNLTAGAVEEVIQRLDGSSSQAKPEVCKKMRLNVPKEAMAKIVTLVTKALRKEKATVTDLRGVLTQVRDDLKRLSKGIAS